MIVQKRKVQTVYPHEYAISMPDNYISVYDVPFAGLGLPEIPKLIMTGGPEGEGEGGVAYLEHFLSSSIVVTVTSTNRALAMSQHLHASLLLSSVCTYMYIQK